MSSINFLAQQNLELAKHQKQDKLIFRYVLLAFIVVSIVVTGSFGTYFYFTYRLKKVDTQINTVRKKIEAEKSLETDYLFFVNKMIAIRRLFDQRTNKQLALGYFENLFGPNISISGLEYSMEEGRLSLIVGSPHVFYLEEAFEVLEKPEVQEPFISMAKSNLRRNDNGEYVFLLTITFSEESELVIIEEDY